jgi:site-specific DNA-methyltransferase (adenine-specific)
MSAPYLADPDATVWHGDVREILPELEAESVDCALTSPPFYGLRDYGADGQIGLEASPDEWCANLVAVFRELRRVLKPAGTLWVECGDSYKSTAPGTVNAPARIVGAGGRDGAAGLARARLRPLLPDLKSKDLIGAPWLLAFALRADGWYLRQCIVWAKPNAMPESVRDRCTTAHSYVFLLSKSPRYFFDADAIAEPAEWAAWGAQTDLKRGQPGSENARGTGMGFDKYGRQRIKEMQNGHGSKNARSVWTIPTQGYPGAHFATWPEKLVERILLAGCPEWVCSACGKARERLTERESLDPELVQKQVRGASGKSGRVRGGTDDSDTTWSHRTTEKGTVPSFKGSAVTEVGWSDCGCGAGFQPGVCLDPFAGSGTTLQVARRLGRRSVGVELNEGYCRMIGERLQQLSLLA